VLSTFESLISPPERVIRELTDHYPCVPFVTPEYIQACAAAGEIPCALLEREGELLSAGTIGFLRAGRLSSSLHIPTAPRLSDPGRYWQALQWFCRRRRIWRLLVQSFASNNAVIPRLQGETARYSRIEHVITLGHGGNLSLSPDRRRNVAKARRAGLTIAATRSASDLDLHASLVNAALHKRASRGEEIAVLGAASAPGASLETAAASPFDLALLAVGAAELFQARRGGEVLSSLFVIRAPQAVYSRSSGSSDLGMTLGAPTFVIAALAERFQEEGKREFNLGGSGPPSTGLWQFKAGFGGEQRPLEAVEVSTEPALIGALRWASAIPRRWRRNRGAAAAGTEPHQ